MKDYIAIADYKRYLLEYSLPQWKAKSDKAKLAYAEAKQKYESGWFARLFRWKYERSTWCGIAHWDFHEDIIENGVAELTRCEYFEKQGTTHIQSNLNVNKTFYYWCKQNNIPH